MLYKFRCAVARFMYGRNGMDQMNQILLWVYLALCILRALLVMRDEVCPAGTGSAIC